MLLQRSVSWRQSNEPLLTIIFTFSRNSPQFTRSTLISSTATRFLRSAHIFSRSTKQIHGQGGDYFFPWEREHTRRVATSYLLSFAYTLFVSGFSLFAFPCPSCCAEHASVSSTRHWAFSRASAPISAASCLWVLLLSTVASPFSILLSPYRQIDLPSSPSPCCMIWFEEILKGSYKVVLCPRSGEGYFGLARRTYSLQCPPDIAAVRLFRFTFRFCG